MNTFYRGKQIPKMILALLVILASATIVPQVWATTISLVPYPQKVHVPPPANVSVDIIVSDLETALAAFDVEVIYDFGDYLLGIPYGSLVLLGGNLGNRLGNPDPTANEVVFGASTVNGLFKLFEVSLLNANELEDLQTDPAGNLLNSFRLATLDFAVVSGPPSGFVSLPLAFGDVVLRNYSGITCSFL